MQKQIDVIGLLSAAAMRSQRAGSYPPETHVIELSELREILFEMREEGQEANSRD